MRYHRSQQQDLQQARRRQGLTQEEAAACIGCCVRTYKAWESEGVKPLGVWDPAIAAFIAREVEVGD